jgi:hypothetical protein
MHYRAPAPAPPSLPSAKRAAPHAAGAAATAAAAAAAAAAGYDDEQEEEDEDVDEGLVVLPGGEAAWEPVLVVDSAEKKDIIRDNLVVRFPHTLCRMSGRGLCRLVQTRPPSPPHSDHQRLSSRSPLHIPAPPSAPVDVHA